MGCDIHMYVEHKVGNKWVFETTFYDNHRHYALFSLLADVRNEDELIIPISTPKGIPSQISDEVKYEYDLWDCDAHSHSYYSLAELFRYKEASKTNTITHSGHLSENEYRNYLETGSVNSWCGWVSGPGVQIIPEKTMKAFISGELKKEIGQYYYTSIKWDVPIIEEIGYFFDELETLTHIDENYDNVRLVFWFDN